MLNSRLPGTRASKHSGFGGFIFCYTSSALELHDVQYRVLTTLRRYTKLFLYNQIKEETDQVWPSIVAGCMAYSRAQSLPFSFLDP